MTRNRRRLSAKRYKGVAKITCRRARKGFSIKFNPDAHYNTAMYRGLDHLQLKDGKYTLVLNRDDAAGFRLDTTFTHKQHASLATVDQPEQTTRSDYLNKYTSILQVSSYLFMSTETTKEVCCGVVKAHTLFEKSPVQHAADLQMLEENPEFASIFHDKRVECVRVDGCSDEAPSHEEVQFYWTERHLIKANESIVVTT